MNLLTDFQTRASDRGGYERATPKGGKQAVQANIREFYHASVSKPIGQKRGRRQIIAVAFAAARGNKE